MKVVKSILILIQILLISCNNSEKKIESNLEKSFFNKIQNKKNTKNHSEVIFSILVQERDVFQLFYIKDYFLEFSEEQSVFKSFLGRKGYQDVIFKLPKDILPVSYRFDIGNNKDLKKIKIKSITIRYNKNEIIIPENYLINYLTPNDNITYNESDNTFNLSSIEKNGNLVYDPYFTCSPQLVKLLFKLKKK